MCISKKNQKIQIDWTLNHVKFHHSEITSVVDIFKGMLIVLR